MWTYSEAEAYFRNHEGGELDMFFAQTGAHVCHCPNRKSNCQWEPPSNEGTFLLKSTYGYKKCIHEGSDLFGVVDCTEANRWIWTQTPREVPTATPTISPTDPTATPTAFPTKWVLFSSPLDEAIWIINETFAIEWNFGPPIDDTTIRLEL